MKAIAFMEDRCSAPDDHQVYLALLSSSGTFINNTEFDTFFEILYGRLVPPLMIHRYLGGCGILPVIPPTISA